MTKKTAEDQADSTAEIIASVAAGKGMPDRPKRKYTRRTPLDAIPAKKAPAKKTRKPKAQSIPLEAIPAKTKVAKKAPRSHNPQHEAAIMLLKTVLKLLEG